ncbi:MAG: hypothetical protein Q7J54_00555 [Candidatus Woesearchaeota archaeon]|nr:hypothetical protein [Candidatus Woesearchaeota archaeon]
MNLNKPKKLIKNIRVIILLIAILAALFAISFNPWNEGAAIRNVIPNSSASMAGIKSPSPNLAPMARERVISINNIPVKTVDDYYNITNAFGYNITFALKTNKDFYTLITKPKLSITILNETEIKTITEEYFNATLNKTVNRTYTIEAPKTITKIIGVEDIGLGVYPAPKTNIRKGLDLQGGVRVLLTPEEKLSADNMAILLDNMKERLNVYGLSDIVVREAGDLSGNQFILVEIAGANEEEAKNLIAQQGKFEARIGNDTVFKGEKKDITYVCRSADCAGIDPNAGCSQFSGGWSCRFWFRISLSPDASQRQADLTRNLTVKVTDASASSREQYLDKPLDLFLDGTLVDSLNIALGLKGKAETDIAISGSGVGATQQEAINNALQNMKRLQTILVTGSLPAKLEIVKTDNISPALGEEFLKNAIFMGLIAVLAVVAVLVIVYRKLLIALPIMFTCLVEIFLVLGLAAVIGWNVDLAAIAAIIVSVGTGVDDQIVITDEILKGEKSEAAYDWKKRIKNAFFIIFGAYLTLIAAMTPLYFAGAGLLRGFALTTILAISIGVFITRPAYAVIVEALLKD